MVDNCAHDFNTLVNSVLPQYMDELQKRLASPLPMSDFATPGVGVRALLRREGLEHDFSGCYVLLEGKRPFYVGISRKVFYRLRQHVRGTSHFDATLAYRIATARTGHTMQRSEAMANAEFREQFLLAQQNIRSLNVAYVEIENPLELHVFEAYAALELGTGDWNSFETH